jgi:hypothetical protein
MPERTELLGQSQHHSKTIPSGKRGIGNGSTRRFVHALYQHL